MLGALWLLDAALQAQPHLFGAEWWHDDLAQSVMGQPSPIARSILWVVNRMAGHSAVWNTSFVIAEAILGLCLLAGRLERAAITASIPWALGIWWIGEGFGSLPSGFGLSAAGSPGPVLLYPLLGLLAWPSPSERPRLPPSAVHADGALAGWAALWVGGAAMLLPWKFAPGRVLQANLEEHSVDQPRWLAGIAHHTYQLVGAHPLLVPVALATAEVLVGLGVLHGRSQRMALAVGILLSVVFWVVFQELGGIVGGDATDPGIAPLLVLLAFAMWPSPPMR